MMVKSVIGILLLAGLVVLSGCSGQGNKTVAKVDGYDIKADELNDYFSRIRKPFAAAQDEFNQKRELIDTMVVSRLLIQAAYEKNIDKLEELARIILDNKDKFLLAALYEKHVASKVEPTEAEIRDYYNKLEFRVRASHIVVNNLDTAQMLFGRLQKGESFEQLAFDYSIDPGAKRNKGDLEYFTWGDLADEFQEAAFAMEVGELSPPVKSPFGYHIIKIVDKAPNEYRGEFEAMKDIIKQRMVESRSRNLIQKYFDEIKAKYPVTIDTATCAYLLHKRDQMYPPQLLATLPRNNFDFEQLDRNERELVLATWDGGQLTLYEYLKLITDNVPKEIWPGLDNYDSLAIIVFELKKPEILTTEALREGLDNDDVYLKQMKTFKELNMADIMRNDSIPMPPPPDEGVVRKYYDDNPGEFTEPATVHIYEILMSDELKARRITSQLSSLEKFKEAAKELTERPGRRAKSGDLGYIERQWYPQIFDLAYKTQVGKVGGPVVVAGKYSIFYVVDKIEPQLKEFVAVKKTIVDKLTREQKNRAFEDWVDQRLKAADVKVYDDAIWATIDMSKYAQADSTGQ